MMKWFSFLWVSICFAVLQASEKPNVVFILSDDMGYGDIQAYNPKSKIPTPHLNQLAKDGIKYIDAHAAGSVCVPSRYGLMTGRYPMRAPTMKSKQGPVIQAKRPTIASLLGKHGYQTHMVGKWHLGFKMFKVGEDSYFNYAQPLKDGPKDRGFDHFWGMHASLDIPPYFFINGRDPVLPPTQSIGAKDSVGTDEGWNHIQGAFWRAGPVSPDFKHEEITPRFQNEAIKVIDQYAQSDKKKPLFLYLALPSPHTPWLPLEQFRGKSGAGMYGDFVMQVDDVVGHVRQALAKNHLSENTLVFFSSDNGPVWYDKDREKFDHDAVGGLKGMKFSPHEGGHRVPFLVSWPNKIKPNQTSAQLLSFVDVYATLADMVGQKKMAKGEAEDSHSFYASFTSPEKPTKRPVLNHDFRAVRQGPYKLIGPFKKQKEAMLFNVVKDPEENNNLAESKPELVAKLKKLLVVKKDG